MKLLENNRLFALLLFIGSALIFVMVLLGGVTRLSGSGLSIVEWQLFQGIFPPLTQHDWMALFSQYQASPEYQKINFGMGLIEFKQIFWLEYIHRLWGRLIGLYFLFLIFYALRKKSLRSYVASLLALWVLGGIQGVVGWYMVKSGLVEDPYVSPYRLSMHLMLAILTYGWALNLGLKLWYARKGTWNYREITAVSFVLLTILFGGLVAGHKAGLIYNTFPLMGETWIPEELFFETPWWKDLIHNPVSIQFIHRLLAMITFIFLGYLALQRRGFYSVVFAIATLQAILGISTLLLHVPLFLAASHQAIAIVLLTSLWIAFYQRFDSRQVFSFKPFKKSTSCC
ncbi:MAG: COX15/CtaA family protein [Candidatus Paracaedimonas acanthamoebae]|uniref:COX15/CtaA family protein n=1 Tax=Candidatus Paracaedimonas acanthamoebae TaxID=244581 RepID=A0A8J7PJZ0_9PROT|nr:COX15/CtaA family protein [Candidatus Paracaedimonas acanthamoebae]